MVINMDFSEFNNILISAVERLRVKLNSQQTEQFYEYMKLLLEWNEKINLTAITKPNEIIIKHFIDSLTINRYIEKGSKVIDIGTGAGFPGIPLKILRDDIEILLLDSLNKRIIFLEEVINKLNLKKVECIHARAEELGQNKNYREKYDVAVSRAVASATVLAEFMLPYVKIGGQCICMKGPKLEEELEQSQNAITILGGRIEAVEKIILPDTDMERNILIIRKETPTENSYPRKMSKIKQSPLRLQFHI